MTRDPLDSDIPLMDIGGVRTLESAYRDCEERLGRPATNIEVCEELGITLQDLYDELEHHRELTLGKYEEIEDTQPGSAETFVRYVPFTWDEEVCYVYAQSDFSNALSRAVNTLPRNEQLVLYLRYRQNLSLKKIAALIGLSETRVALIHTTAMLRVRPKLSALRDQGSRIMQDNRACSRHLQALRIPSLSQESTLAAALSINCPA